MKVTFRILNKKGDEPLVCDTLEQIEEEFTKLVSRGYAAFLDEIQITGKDDLRERLGNVSETEIIMVPSIAGGRG